MKRSNITTPVPRAERGATLNSHVGPVYAAEKHVLSACLTYLNTLPGVKAWRQQTGAVKATYRGKQRFIRYGQVGQADITGMIHGLRLEVEVKATGKKPSEAQFEWAKFIQANGGVAFYCDSLESCSANMRRVFEERGLNWRKEWEI